MLIVIVLRNPASSGGTVIPGLEPGTPGTVVVVIHGGCREHRWSNTAILKTERNIAGVCKKIFASNQDFSFRIVHQNEGVLIQSWRILIDKLTKLLTSSTSIDFHPHRDVTSPSPRVNLNDSCIYGGSQSLYFDAVLIIITTESLKKEKTQDKSDFYAKT